MDYRQPAMCVGTFNKDASRRRNPIKTSNLYKLFIFVNVYIESTVTTAHNSTCTIKYPFTCESNIYITGVKKDHDYDDLLNAARKAVEHGYTVYILPNPKDIRSADFIFVRKGVYKMFDLKTIHGKTIVGSRLIESIGQTNHVVLNMTISYDPRLLAKDVQHYFETKKEAREVLIIRGNKFLSVSRRFVEGKDYIKMFMKRYLRQ